MADEDDSDRIKARTHSGYMLVYVKEDMIKETMALEKRTGVKAGEITEAVQERCRRELEEAEARKLARQEAASKVELRIVDEKLIRDNMHGFWNSEDLGKLDFKKTDYKRDKSVLELMVEEKFEKYFGYLARCEGKFCTTTLYFLKNHIKINQNACKMPSKFKNKTFEI